MSSSISILNNNNNMLIKMFSLVMALIIVQSSICQSLVIPDSKNHQLKADERQYQDSSSNNNNNNVRQQRSTIAGEPIWDGITSKFTGKRVVLTKRSIGDDNNAAYAGHSIMRFGRAPHNIMHFGKRSNNDEDTAAIANQLETMSNQVSETGSPFSDDYLMGNKGSSSVRYILVPVMVSPSSSSLSHLYSSQPLSSSPVSASDALRHYLTKKSAENLETSRGVFMHFG
ncbi:hypothetical protein DERP_002281 [Dermatophagoides pteronyssinus]|uniref:Uncharacterized protein LOC113791579 n=2 Tax=Dermatophagoides pteronyssinus TaxID=6956 RepID=A0A6P6XVZ5_DERPT|nr:uncharacterized protein LOC113791579 [Dermatophagoides pteronyssinus]KAH9421991.1 hypothetical protein DERP_002281 [Dermatophagoides pteronyssinus]